jgi:peptidoglycan/xylan/chitin deacetylase (PgdA/CDA1 family)
MIPRSHAAGVPMLMYHQVSADPAPEFRKYSVTPSAFSRQMDVLWKLGYRSVTLDQLLRCREGTGSLPPRPVVITFDDGFRESVEHAVPILSDRGFTAIFYLVAGLIGRNSRWLAAEKGVEFPLADWDTLRGLAAAGIECGAHTCTHPRLAELSAAACREELVTAKQLLEDGLGREVRHMAYPFGSHDDAVRTRVIEAGYASASSSRPGLSPPDDDPFALRRVFVSGHDSLPDFVWRLHGRRPVTDVAQRALRSIRRWTKRGLNTVRGSS